MQDTDDPLKSLQHQLAALDDAGLLPNGTPKPAIDDSEIVGLAADRSRKLFGHEGLISPGRAMVFAVGAVALSSLGLVLSGHDSEPSNPNPPAVKIMEPDKSQNSPGDLLHMMKNGK